MVTQLPLHTPGLVAALVVGAVFATACGDSEGGTGGSGGEGGSSSKSSSSEGEGEGGGAAAEVCTGDDLDDCFFECDYLNNCLDAATQQDCRDHCRVVSPTACQDYSACGQRDSSCDNAEDCWNVFRDERSASGSGGGGDDPACSTACANVTAQCGDDGGIDFATCMEQCPDYSASAVQCAKNASSCDAVLNCIGAGGD